MSERAAHRAKFLAESPWRNWTAKPIAADASARNYERLTGPNGDTVILMDADPAKGEDTQAFRAMAAYLVDAGFAAPVLLKSDPDNGFLVLTDLGTTNLAKTPDHDQAYEAACDVLIALHKATPPAGLSQLSPTFAADAVMIVADWYAPQCDRNRLYTTMHETMTRLAPAPETLALRDFHAENLIWRADESGLSRIGLLDFQDALKAPPGYDLVSLLRDVRQDVPPILQARLRNQFQEATDVSDAALACLAAQRNLRILGIFARLAKRDGKDRYLAFLPRLWRLLAEDLEHPELANLRAIFATFPTPEEVFA